MNKTIIVILFILSISLVSAQEICEYNGVKTTFGTLYYGSGVKSEYADEKFVHIVDPKAITDLRQLKGLICLEHADFYNQGISGNLENLNDLANLKVLSLHTNPDVEGDVCDFSKAIKLKSLKLAFDPKVHGDVSCLKNINLETFAMTYTNISGNLSGLSHMTNLKALYLSGAGISGDVSALSVLTNLEELSLSNAEMDGSKFYGDLASLDNLKKLRKVALYNLNSINCEHFHEMHPNIEGGCSEESKYTLTDPNMESEKMIEKESIPADIAKDGEPRVGDEPPKECMIDGKFIGEDKCPALVDKGLIEGQNNGPPEKCIIDGDFIGRERCEALMQGKIKDAEQEVEEKITETETNENVKRSFLERFVDWFVSLFK
ncbi:MAG TPA: hypothetical protein VJH97_00245 [Candidatus Nanoarchaeia archaeon]|nr:hypothetical protein [Candidatus Nanoarchaeia archaeon]